MNFWKKIGSIQISAFFRGSLIFWPQSVYINIYLFGFSCLMTYQLFLGYLMPKPFSEKNSSGAI